MKYTQDNCRVCSKNSRYYTGLYYCKVCDKNYHLSVHPELSRIESKYRLYQIFIFISFGLIYFSRKWYKPCSGNIISEIIEVAIILFVIGLFIYITIKEAKIVKKFDYIINILSDTEFRSYLVLYRKKNIQTLLVYSCIATLILSSYFIFKPPYFLIIILEFGMLGMIYFPILRIRNINETLKSRGLQ